jgi:hypothetical protein
MTNGGGFRSIAIFIRRKISKFTPEKLTLVALAME